MARFKQGLLSTLLIIIPEFIFGGGIALLLSTEAWLVATVTGWPIPYPDSFAAVCLFMAVMMIAILVLNAVREGVGTLELVINFGVMSMFLTLAVLVAAWLGAMGALSLILAVGLIVRAARNRRPHGS